MLLHILFSLAGMLFCYICTCACLWVHMSARTHTHTHSRTHTVKHTYCCSHKLISLTFTWSFSIQLRCSLYQKSFKIFLVWFRCPLCGSKAFFAHIYSNSSCGCWFICLSPLLDHHTVCEERECVFAIVLSVPSTVPSTEQGPKAFVEWIHNWIQYGDTDNWRKEQRAYFFKWRILFIS